MTRRIATATSAEALGIEATDWRKTRALEMARRKAAGWHVDRIARFYRVGRTIVYRELAGVPAEILARLVETLEGDR